MFRVDRTQNRIFRLAQKRFGDLALRERDHLQEWLVHQPDALGEDLLILQKEFDGFDETRERLDLLALDKAGNLVVIENKLDDSGRDVTWQALKYAAYTSGLKKTQIVDIHQQYLDRYCGGGNAVQAICDFMEVEDLDEAVLNPGNGQRILFVAASFRREVTATALWLISRGIAVQCFRVTPFGFGEELFLDLQQIIPPPEAEDYMIGIASKEVEETTSIAGQKRRHMLRRDFWELTLDQMRSDGVPMFANISPSNDNWLSAGSGIGSCPFQILYLQDGVRVQLAIGKSSGEINKRIFDRLYAQKAQIENEFGAALDWRRLDHRKVSLITHEQSFDGLDREIWPQMSKWLSVYVQKLEAALRAPLAEIGRNPKVLEG